jgi:choline dehydrogenase
LPALSAGQSRRGSRSPRTLDCVREIVVAAGAIGSPALLMRSGVGSQCSLEWAYRWLPTASQALQEHPPSASTSSSRLIPTTADEALAHRRIAAFTCCGGADGDPSCQAMALAVRADLAEPDLQLHLPSRHDPAPSC